MATYVSTITNVDGSLIFNPTSGNAIGSLNPAHANTWTALQHFLAQDLSTPAILLDMAIDQAAAALAIRDAAHFVRAEFAAPRFDWEGCNIYLNRSDGSEACAFTADRLTLRGDGSGDSFTLQITDEVAATTGSFFLAALAGPAVIAAATRINAELTTSIGEGISCVLSAENPSGDFDLSLLVTAFVDSAEKEVLKVNADGTAELTELVAIGNGAAGSSAQVNIVMDADRPGLRVTAAVALSGGQQLLDLLDVADGRKFSVEKSGKVWTNQAIEPGTTGSVLKLLPFYDATGVLLGYAELKSYTPPPSSYATDHFVDTDGTLLTAHTMDLGTGWIDALNTMQIESNSATSSGEQYFSCVTNTAGSDCTVEVKYTDNGTIAFADTYAGVLLRSDGTHRGYYLMQRSRTLLELGRLDAPNTHTALATYTTTLTHGTQFTFKLIASGSALLGFLNGSLVISTTDSTYPTGTYQGLIGYYGANYVPKFNDFSVTP
jgi:hypothetical protein